jgi:hypothetical protein
MSNRNLAVFAALAFGFVSAASVARSQPAESPLVVLPQGDFSCLAEVTSHIATPKPDPAHPNQHFAALRKEIAITRIGAVRRDVTTWTDGSVSELWSLDDQGVTLWQTNGPGRAVYLFRGPRRDELTVKLLRLDAASVAWIKKQNLVGNEEGTLHYQAIVTLPESGPKPRTAIYQAWIDPKTLQLKKLDDGDNLYTLTVSPDRPAGPLVMPPDIQAEYNRWVVAMTPHPHVN